jgi:predicted transcriptional regulator of viral defense system
MRRAASVRNHQQELRRSLMRMAAEQRGYFTAAQALEHQYSYQVQKFHADHGNRTCVDRGLFRIPEWPIADDDQLVRWSLWARSKAVVTHATALSAHGLGDVDLARVHLTVPRSFRASAAGVVSHRGQVDPDQVEDRGGYRISNPAHSCDVGGMGAGELIE